MKTFISAVDAFEILDSRGQPTLQVNLRLANGVEGAASVPSGASTGEFEAHELRDGDLGRYGGRGVRLACEMIGGEIAPRLIGRDVTDQSSIDRLRIELD